MTAVRLLTVSGRPAATPVKALLPPPPPFQPVLVLRGLARYVGLLTATWAPVLAAGYGIWAAF